MTNPLYARHCAFTGKLEKYTRKEAMQILSDLGGFAEKGVTKNTDFLILGTPVKEGKSHKLLKAEKYQENGQNIAIIPEYVFYEMLGAAGYGQISMREWVWRRNEEKDEPESDTRNCQ